ncbi:hypothetical protein BJX76DRAFT_306186 [Aspergillus varians]
MDDVPQKRPQQPDDTKSHPLRSVTLPKRPRSDNPAQHIVTSNGGRELSAPSAVNDRKASSTAHSGDDEDDDDYTSSSGSSLSSSDDDNDDDEDDDQNEAAGDSNNVLNGDNEGITSVPARRKPHIRRIDKEPSVLSKLSAFLPKMKSANEDLQRDIAAGGAKDIRLDDYENDNKGDGRYIEMNLGLGVLEEKRPGDDQSSGDGERDFGAHEPSDDTNLMDHLMGKKRTTSSEKPSIQDLDV